ncbi:MAG: DUF501 domain-containing protein [Actinomycetota bacterium]|nr:DUF501 domain-containing protein [Actinomycetota bacterium]
MLALQIGRAPRSPWRTAVRCGFGHPSVIASPSRLEDGTPFPTLMWLTCPWLVEHVGEAESAGATTKWAQRASTEPELADALTAADAAVRVLRAGESGGDDACAGTGIAGQRDPLGVKCLHAHVALVLAGVADPIGGAVLGQVEPECPDDRCGALIAAARGGPA